MKNKHVNTRKYAVDEVIRSLNNKHDCRIMGNRIEVLTGRNATNDLGNGSWGRIDFLTHYYGFYQCFVKEF
jgi:hypothetical protein